MKIAVLLPIKGFSEAKSRLCDVLEPDQRAGLVKAMAQDVLSASRQTKSIDHILVVSRDPEAAQIAETFGAEILACPTDTDLNAGIVSALNHLTNKGFDRAIILHGDLPLIRGDDIDDTASSGGLAAVKARADGGTTVLSLPLPSPICPAFGHESFEQHSELARAQGLELIELDLPRAAFDIDTASDLKKLRNILKTTPERIGQNSRDFLNQMIP